jgi:hypothetical protein
MRERPHTGVKCELLLIAPCAGANEVVGEGDAGKSGTVTPTVEPMKTSLTFTATGTAHFEHAWSGAFE